MISEWLGERGGGGEDPRGGGEVLEGVWRNLEGGGGCWVLLGCDVQREEVL